MATEKGIPSDRCQQQGQTVLNVQEVSIFLRVSEGLVRRLIRQRRIPFFKIGGRYLFYRPSVEQWFRDISDAPDKNPPIVPNIDPKGDIWG